MVRLAMTDSQAKPAAKVSPLKGPMTPVDRRALLTALGGAAIATMAQPLSAHAQAAAADAPDRRADLVVGI